MSCNYLSTNNFTHKVCSTSQQANHTSFQGRKGKRERERRECERTRKIETLSAKKKMKKKNVYLHFCFEQCMKKARKKMSERDAQKREAMT
jgi:hypothetical protein